MSFIVSGLREIMPRSGTQKQNIRGKLVPSLIRVGCLSAAVFGLGGCAVSKLGPGPTIAKTELAIPVELGASAPSTATSATSAPAGDGKPKEGAAPAASAPDVAKKPGGYKFDSEAPASKRTVLDHAATTFAENLYLSANKPEDTTRAQAAFRSGRALLDLHCNEYLDALSTANQQAGNQRKQIGVIGGFVSAVMGLAASPAKHVAGVATAFSASGSSMDAFTASYLFSDAAGAITKLVRDSQSTYLLSLTDSFPDLRYDDAVNLLTGYEQLCRPAHIRSMIDQAIAVSKATPEEPGALRGEAAVTTVIQSLTGVLGKVPTEGEAVALYAWFLADATGKKAVEENSDFVKQLVDRDKELGKKLSSVLVPLTLTGNPVHRRWIAAATKLQAPETKATPAAPPPPAPSPAPTPASPPTPSPPAPPPPAPKLIIPPVIKMRGF